MNDSVLELNEAFTASLNSSDHIKLIPNSVSVAIIDDDGAVPVVYYCNNNYYVLYCV